MPTTLDILVFVASPLDYARYRHMALYIEFGEDKGTDAGARSNSAIEENVRSSIMEIVGSPGFFSFSERVNAELPAQATSKSRRGACFLFCFVCLFVLFFFRSGTFVHLGTL